MSESASPKISPKKAPRRGGLSSSLKIAQKGATRERDGAASEPVVMNGVGMIAAERKRQIEKEDWSAEHDDSHTSACLAAAAGCYAILAAGHGDVHDGWKKLYIEASTQLWPFDPEWFKPTSDPIRLLEKAGALIAAEIDRLLRKKVREAGRCPQCGELAVFPRDLDPYCEDCGWPEENRPEHKEDEGGAQ